MIENLISLLPSIATTLLQPKCGLLKFLLKRVGADKLPAERDQNRFYTGEVLSILLGLAVDGIKEGRERLATEDAVDGLLKVLSVSPPFYLNFALACNRHSFPSPSCRSTAVETQLAPTRPSSWRTSSTPSAPLSRNRKSRRHSSKEKGPS